MMVMSYLNNERNGPKNQQMSLQNKENPFIIKGNDKKPIKKYNKTNMIYPLQDYLFIYLVHLVLVHSRIGFADPFG